MRVWLEQARLAAALTDEQPQGQVLSAVTPPPRPTCRCHTLFCENQMLPQTAAPPTRTQLAKQQLFNASGTSLVESGHHRT